MKTSRRNGYSLVELLTVIAVITLVIGLSNFSMRGVIDGRNVDRSINDIIYYLSYAQSQALAKNTYVWVGLSNVVNNGQLQLKVCAVRSLDGTSVLGSGNAPNYTAISKVYTFPSIVLVSYPSLSATLQQNITQQGLAPDSTYTYDIGNMPPLSTQFQVGPQIFDIKNNLGLNQGQGTISDGMIVFTPQGESLACTYSANSAIPPTEPVTRQILGLRSARGTALPANDMNCAAIFLYGVGGQPYAIH